MTKEEFIGKWTREMLESNRIAFSGHFIGCMFDDATIDRNGIIAELLILVEKGKLMNSDIANLTERARHMIGVCKSQKD